LLPSQHPFYFSTDTRSLPLLAAFAFLLFSFGSATPPGEAPAETAPAFGLFLRRVLSFRLLSIETIHLFTDTPVHKSLLVFLDHVDIVISLFVQEDIMFLSFHYV
jgi:hypothetical protein